MKNYVLLTCMVMSGFIVEASQDPAPKRNLSTDEEVRYVKELVRNDGPQAFIDALTAGEFDEEIYEMPLDDIKVQVQDSQTSLADILLGLNSMDYTFERIQSAFFSKRHGLEYLKRCLADVANLSAMNQFLQKYPWALNYLNPFKVLTDTYSLGYYVEIGLLRKDPSALAIKDLYGNHWDVHFKREMIDAEEGLLEIERITATLLDLYHQKGINGVINGLQRYDLNDADKKVDLGAITVPVGGVDTPLIKLIKEECRSGNQGAQIIYAKYVSNNVKYFDRLLEEAFTTKNYETVADEIVCCPTLARYLFRPEIMLDLQVDQLDATGDRHAQAIKSAVGPYEWDQLREYYKDARHLRICFNKGKLDDEGRQILAQVNSDATVANYVARLKTILPKAITNALQGQDMSKINMIESWVDELAKAGIDFDTGNTIAQVQGKLKQRKIEIAALKGGTNGGGNSPAKTPWLTPTKLFLIGVGCVVAYVAFDQLKKYSDEDQPEPRQDRAQDFTRAS